MTVPQPRGDDAAGVGVVRGDLREIRDEVRETLRDMRDEFREGLRDMGARLDAYGRAHVPIDRFEDLRARVAEGLAEHDKDVVAVRAEIKTEGTKREALEARLTEGRRWAVVAAIAAATAIVGFVGVLIALLTFVYNH